MITEYAIYTTVVYTSMQTREINLHLKAKLNLI